MKLNFSPFTEEKPELIESQETMEPEQPTTKTQLSMEENHILQGTQVTLPGEEESFPGADNVIPELHPAPSTYLEGAQQATEASASITESETPDLIVPDNGAETPVEIPETAIDGAVVITKTPEIGEPEKTVPEEATTANVEWESTPVISADIPEDKERPAIKEGPGITEKSTILFIAPEAGQEPETPETEEQMPEERTTVVPTIELKLAEIPAGESAEFSSPAPNEPTKPADEEAENKPVMPDMKDLQELQLPTRSPAIKETIFLESVSGMPETKPIKTTDEPMKEVTDFALTEVPVMIPEEQTTKETTVSGDSSSSTAPHFAVTESSAATTAAIPGTTKEMPEALEGPMEEEKKPEAEQPTKISTGGSPAKGKPEEKPKEQVSDVTEGLPVEEETSTEGPIGVSIPVNRLPETKADDGQATTEGEVQITEGYTDTQHPELHVPYSMMTETSHIAATTQHPLGKTTETLVSEVKPIKEGEQKMEHKKLEEEGRTTATPGIPAEESTMAVAPEVQAAVTKTLLAPKESMTAVALEVPAEVATTAAPWEDSAEQETTSGSPEVTAEESTTAVAPKVSAGGSTTEMAPEIFAEKSTTAAAPETLVEGLTTSMTSGTPTEETTTVTASEICAEGTTIAVASEMPSEESTTAAVQIPEIKKPAEGEAQSTEKPIEIHAKMPVEEPKTKSPASKEPESTESSQISTADVSAAQPEEEVTMKGLSIESSSESSSEESSLEKSKPELPTLGESETESGEGSSEEVKDKKPTATEAQVPADKISEEQAMELPRHPTTGAHKDQEEHTTESTSIPSSEAPREPEERATETAIIHSTGTPETQGMQSASLSSTKAPKDPGDLATESASRPSTEAPGKPDELVTESTSFTSSDATKKHEEQETQSASLPSTEAPKEPDEQATEPASLPSTETPRQAEEPVEPPTTPKAQTTTGSLPKEENKKPAYNSSGTSTKEQKTETSVPKIPAEPITRPEVPKGTEATVTVAEKQTTEKTKEVFAFPGEAAIAAATGEPTTLTPGEETAEIIRAATETSVDDSTTSAPVIIEDKLKPDNNEFVIGETMISNPDQEEENTELSISKSTATTSEESAGTEVPAVEAGEQITEAVGLPEVSSEALTPLIDESSTSATVPGGPVSQETEKPEIIPEEAKATEGTPETENPVTEAAPNGETRPTESSAGEQEGQVSTEFTVEIDEGTTVSSEEDKGKKEKTKKPATMEAQAPMTNTKIPETPTKEKPTESPEGETENILTEAVEKVFSDTAAPEIPEASTDATEAPETLTVPETATLSTEAFEDKVKEERLPGVQENPTEASIAEGEISTPTLVTPVGVEVPVELPSEAPAAETETPQETLTAVVEDESAATEKLPAEEGIKKMEITTESDTAAEKPTTLAQKILSQEGKKEIDNFTEGTLEQEKPEEPITSAAETESSLGGESPTEGSFPTLDTEKPVKEVPVISTEETPVDEIISTEAPQTPEVKATEKIILEEDREQSGKPFQEYGPPTGVPGEGNCLVDGQSFANNSAIPPSNPCQLSCHCVSSIVQCDLVKCLPPPSHLSSCMPVHNTAAGESCCPTYSCDSVTTVTLESDNQRRPESQERTTAAIVPEVETTKAPDAETTPTHAETTQKTIAKMTEEPVAVVTPEEEKSVFIPEEGIAVPAMTEEPNVPRERTTEAVEIKQAQTETAVTTSEVLTEEAIPKGHENPQTSEPSSEEAKRTATHAVPKEPTSQLAQSVPEVLTEVIEKEVTEVTEEAEKPAESIEEPAKNAEESTKTEEPSTSADGLTESVSAKEETPAKVSTESNPFIEETSVEIPSESTLAKEETPAEVPTEAPAKNPVITEGSTEAVPTEIFTKPATSSPIITEAIEPEVPSSAPESADGIIKEEVGGPSTGEEETTVKAKELTVSPPSKPQESATSGSKVPVGEEEATVSLPIPIGKEQSQGEIDAQKEIPVDKLAITVSSVTSKEQQTTIPSQTENAEISQSTEKTSLLTLPVENQSTTQQKVASTSVEPMITEQTISTNPPTFEETEAAKTDVSPAATESTTESPSEEKRTTSLETESVKPVESGVTTATVEVKEATVKPTIEAAEEEKEELPTESTYSGEPEVDTSGVEVERTPDISEEPIKVTEASTGSQSEVPAEEATTTIPSEGPQSIDQEINVPGDEATKSTEETPETTPSSATADLTTILPMISQTTLIPAAEAEITEESMEEPTKPEVEVGTATPKEKPIEQVPVEAATDESPPKSEPPKTTEISDVEPTKDEKTTKSSQEAENSAPEVPVEKPTVVPQSPVVSNTGSASDGEQPQTTPVENEDTPIIPTGEKPSGPSSLEEQLQPAAQTENPSVETITEINVTQAYFAPIDQVTKSSPSGEESSTQGSATVRAPEEEPKEATTEEKPMEAAPEVKPTETTPDENPKKTTSEEKLTEATPEEKPKHPEEIPSMTPENEHHEVAPEETPSVTYEEEQHEVTPEEIPSISSPPVKVSDEDEESEQHPVDGQITEAAVLPEDHEENEGQRPELEHGGIIPTVAAANGTTSSDLEYPETPVDNEENPHFPVNSGSYLNPDEDYDEDDQAIYGPGTCRYGGKVYVSAQQIPRDDPCDFCFCFRSDIICLQQSCPPPIPGCHEEPIRGFCCPRYECPVSMATSLNVTTTTTTTTTTLPPHFLSHAYKGAAKQSGCQIRGQAYRVGQVIKSASGPCMHCT